MVSIKSTLFRKNGSENFIWISIYLIYFEFYITKWLYEKKNLLFVFWIQGFVKFESNIRQTIIRQNSFIIHHVLDQEERQKVFWPDSECTLIKFSYKCYSPQLLKIFKINSVGPRAERKTR